MPNTSRISGFRPLKHATGAPYNGQGNIYAVAAADATAIFVGDPVTLDGSANAAGVATVTKAAAAGPVIGVVVGIINAKMDPVTGAMTNGSIALDTPQFRPASTAQYILVEDAPDVIYEAEVVTGANASYIYLAADVGLNVSHSTVAGSTSTGVSAAAADMATKATTATLPFKFLGCLQRPDNETFTGVSTSVKGLFKINAATLGNGTGATGQ